MLKNQQSEFGGYAWNRLEKRIEMSANAKHVGTHFNVV
tara:strand:+ start:338 stop:451 length:114 start_codon:yes stop_codon:yes gene_type:complete